MYFIKEPVTHLSIQGIGDVLEQTAISNLSQLLHSETMVQKEQAAVSEELKAAQRERNSNEGSTYTGFRAK